MNLERILKSTKARPQSNDEMNEELAKKFTEIVPQAIEIIESSLEILDFQNIRFQAINIESCAVNCYEKKFLNISKIIQRAAKDAIKQKRKDKEIERIRRKVQEARDYFNELTSE